MSELLSVIDAMTAIDAHLLPSSVQLTVTEELIQAKDQIDALLASRLQAMEVAEVTVAECGRTTRGWLIEEQRRSPTEARRMMCAARAMPVYPDDLAAAFTAGDISADHVRVILGCLRQLPVDQVEAMLAILLEAARAMDPVTLGQVVREMLLRTGADEYREAAQQRMYADRWARFSTTFGGMVHLEGMLDPESGRTLLAAVEAMMAASRPPVDGDRPAWGDKDSELRTAGQRRADAIVDLARHALAGSQLPDQGGDRPQVLVTIRYDDLAAQLAAADATGTLNGPLGPIPISPETARRLACDADIIPVVLDGDGAVLNLGRSQRTWTTAQRRAARLRDQGCVFPKCQAPLNACDLHHLKHWARGGPTDHDNSAHLCHFHHWLVHHRNWDVTRDPITKKIHVRRT
ncbi:MAG TPA: DUF222 domain-containing protein [Mycobacteriales bacterium]|nr:DUF222 domain-containing protein [Mycobacteriales bacterium]